MSKLRIGEIEREVNAACLTPPLPPSPPAPPHPPGNSASANQQLSFSQHWFDQSILRSFDNFVRSLCSVLVRLLVKEGAGSTPGGSSLQLLKGGKNAWRAGTYSFCMQGRYGWRAGTRGEGRARRAGKKFFLMWGEGGGGGGSVLSACSGSDTLESVQHHYAQETISPSTILCITRRTFYFFSIE
jgi:hypothetical protein